MTHPENPAGRPGPDRPDPDRVDADRVEVDGAPLDARWRAAAEHYNAPPPVPADAMWAAIQARRGRAGAGAPPASEAPSPAPDVIDLPEARDLRVTRLPRGRLVRERAAWRWAPAAAAAALLFGVGIGVGRQTALRAPAEAPPVAAAAGRAPAASGAADTREAPNAATSRPAPAVAASGRAGAAPRDPAPRDAEPRAAAPPAAPTQVARADVPGADAPGGAVPAAAPDAPANAPAGASAPLRAVTEQHLARVEALLTTYAAHDAGAAGAGDARGAPDAAWARDLLTTTRLLLDSPAGQEPGRRALFERLELVLGQIARLPSADSPGERALIDQAIRRGDLMSRLRTAVPAGAPAPASGS